MGFGHRVYKNYDPRARIIKKHVDEVLEATEYNPLIEIATELEKRALDDEYFTERKLYPNVDFYSGLIYEALEIPTDMFTVIFAIPRTSGWVAQWLEMIDDPEQKIARPRQIYTGERDVDYVADRRPRGPREDHQRGAAPAGPQAPRRRRALAATGSPSARAPRSPASASTISTTRSAALERRAEDIRAQGPLRGRRLIRDFEPADRVAGRVEISTGGLLRGGRHRRRRRDGRRLATSPIAGGVGRDELDAAASARPFAAVRGHLR